jgi:hypothetical protein
VAISQPGTAPLDPPSAAPSSPAPTSSAGSALAAAASAAARAANAAASTDEAAIKRVIEDANNAQAEAFLKRNPSLMQATALDGYYQELVQINRGMARDGITAIKLLKIEWGSITVKGDSAEATTFETWRTDYTDGTGDEDRARNVYTLVRSNGSWKIKSDVHPDSGLDQPADAPSASPRPSSPAGASPAPSNQPGRRPGQSRNWSGYSATGGSFTAVSGTWTVPQPSSASPGSDAAWVGIGGVRGRDLIQAGTEQNVSASGRISYQAWTELLPQTSHPVQLKVSPGDSMTVSIAEQPDGSWLIDMKNNTSSQTFQATEHYQSSHSSAEWVEESPSGRRGVLPLSHFGTVRFSAATAVKDGKTVTIAQAGGRPITMIDRDDRPIAQPSALGSDGASFSVERVGLAP